jgi:hypothetical protein
MNEDLYVLGRRKRSEKRPLPDRARRLAKALIAGGTILLLMSWGGAIVGAPALVPALWWANRSSTRWGAVGFTFLAALVMTEAGWAVVYSTIGEEQPWIVLGPVVGVVATVLFFSTNRRGPHPREADQSGVS